jgi:hypothetical protein
VEKDSGRIRVLDLDTRQLAAQAFFTVPPGELSNVGERGLLGLAFHPRYADNGRFYLNLTNESGDTEIWELTRSSDPRVLLTIDRTETNHNGGWIGFGPDGLLYVASGDSGSANDPANAAQSLDDLRGKILRLDVDAESPEPEIYAFGLRNPWRASFDSATGDLYIADVGQNAREEINFLEAGTAAGVNFGWRMLEGTQPTGLPQLGNPAPDDDGLRLPIAEYGHGLGEFEGFSVTGGYVYRGPGAGQGLYFFADFVSNHLWTLRVEDGEAFDFTQRDDDLVVSEGRFDQIASFAVDGSGRLYAVGLDGEIFLLTVVEDESTPSPGGEDRDFGDRVGDAVEGLAKALPRLAEDFFDLF